jgi:RecA-family ATPase
LVQVTFEILSWIDMRAWDTTPVPAREWAVRDCIPMRQATLFSGEGAAGKTILEMQLCAAHVLGRDWVGLIPEPGPAIYIGAEDEETELRRRMTAIAAYYGVTFADLIKNGLHMKSFAGEDMLLAAPDRRGRIVATPLFDRLLEAANDIKPKHIGIDTSADSFGGNEIDRTEVRQFVGLLRKLAIAANGSVVLLSHPSVAGINSGSGLSGSTGWHNSVRARMYLKNPTPVEGEQPDTDLRELTFLKTNYGPRTGSTVLRYRDGLFLPETAVSGLDKMERETQADEVFIYLLKRFDGEGRNVCEKPKSRNFAPTVFAQEDKATKIKLRKAELEAAMRRLFANGRIRAERYGRTDRDYSRIVIK